MTHSSEHFFIRDAVRVGNIKMFGISHLCLSRPAWIHMNQQDEDMHESQFIFEGELFGLCRLIPRHAFKAVFNTVLISNHQPR